MAVRFLIGRAGSGKTHRCVEEITAACAADPNGPPIIYLVPEQASYLSEKALLERGAIDGYTRAQVLSFTRLADYVFARSPADARPRLTTNHRRLIATMLVSRKRREAEDRFFQSAGIEDAVDAFISEMKQYMVDPEKMRAVVQAVAGDGERVSKHLAAKVDALAGLMKDYHRIVAERFQDPEDTLTRLYTAITGEDILQGAEVYVDGFIDFTPAEEKLLVALGRRARRLTITLLGDPSRTERLLASLGLKKSPIFKAVEEALMRLLRVFREGEVAVEKTDYAALDPKQCRFTSPSILHLEHGFFQRRERQAKADGVSFLEPESIREECRLAAEVIAHWLEGRHWRRGETGVLARDIDVAAPFLEEAFRNLGLPCFIDRSAPLDTHPFVTGIQALIRAALHPSRTEHLIALGKSGLLPIQRRHVDLLENYVIQYPRTPSEWYAEAPWPAPPTRSPFDDEFFPETQPFAEEVDSVRRAITDCVRGFRTVYTSESREEGRLGGYLAALCRSVDALVRAGTAWTDDDRRILERIGELFGEEADIAGDEVMTWELAGDLTIRALGALALPRIPPMLNEVFIGQVDRSRHPPLRGVVVIGLVEGEFPRVGQNATLLNDSERDLLREAGIDVRPSQREQFERETLLAYRAFTAASDALVLTRPRARSDGAPSSPSLYWPELLGLFDGATPKVVPDAYIPERCWRPREITAAALRSFDESHRRLVRTERASHVITDSMRTPSGSREVDAIVDAATWRNEAKLSGKSVAEYLGHRLSASSTQLESFGRCPFQHFARFMLRPQGLRRPEFEERDAGQFCHAVLRNFTRLLREEPSGKVGELFERAAAQPRDVLQSAGILTTESGRIMAERLYAMLAGVAAWIVEAAAAIGFHPVEEEAPFSRRKGSVHHALNFGEVAPGWMMEIKGQIDRVDASDECQDEVLVVDYKLRQKRFDYTRWEAGENLQLPLYLLALEQDGRYPVGGLYLEIIAKQEADDGTPKRQYHGIVRSSLIRRAFPDLTKWNQVPFLNGASGDPDEKPRTWGSAIADVEFDAVLEQTRAKLIQAAQRVIAGEIAVHPSRIGTSTPCGYCDLRPICGLDYRLNAPNRKSPPRRDVILQKLREGTE